MHIGLLQQSGLTKNEALIYNTLITIGQAKVSEIIKAANFRSGKIYQVLDSLLYKGLISHIDKNNIKYYAALPPRRMLEYIQSRRRDIEVEEKLFASHLPELESIYHEHKDVCQVKVYEGIEGIRSALLSFVSKLKSNSIILLYGANDDAKRDVMLLWPTYRELTRKKHIRTKVIMTALSKQGRVARAGRNFENYDKEYRALKGSDHSNFMVSGNYVLLFNFDQPNCIVMENKAYAQQFMELFTVLWNVGEKL